MRISCAKNSEKDDHSNACSDSSHRLHMRGLLQEDETRVQRRRQISNHLRQQHLTRVSRSTRHRDDANQQAYRSSKTKTQNDERSLSCYAQSTSRRRNADTIHKASFSIFTNQNKNASSEKIARCTDH